MAGRKNQGKVMNKFVLGFAATMICAALVATDAQAGRLGGSRSMGAQRNVASTPPAAAPAKPAQQAAPAAAPAASPAAAQPQPASGFAKWAPLLGGLALGGALGWLMGANGMGGLLVGMMLVALLVFAAIFVVRMLAQKRGDAPQRMQYAGLGNETVAAPPPSQSAGFDARPVAAAAATNVPDGFDVAGFLRGAKLNFMKLQIANDQGNLEELREFTSDELFEDLKKDLLARGGAKQHTDVTALNADLLEVVTEGDRHWASVRFSGTMRESSGDTPQGFEEVWNLAKPVSGTGGWQLAGIQQMH